ncbi:MAG: phosphoserine phosphatase SerB [Proteobacteria bacterium]|nr:phosphoserine phosphatase SerB [Pseudomonadota bacterium]
MKSLKDKDLFVVSVIGQDRVGLVSSVTGLLFREGLNIVDIEQTVIHSQFTMVILVEPFGEGFDEDRLRGGLRSIAQSQKMNISFFPFREFKGLRFAETKRSFVLTILGTDKPGVVATISKVLSDFEANIERIKMIARGELLAMEMFVDVRGADFGKLGNALMGAAEKIQMDLVVQPEWAYQKRKKLIVFDMDSTIVDAEIIDELAKKTGADDKVRELTARGMAGAIDYEKSLRKRVSLLRGLPLVALDTMVSTLKLTKGTEELISALKEMGFKIALISGGFTYFTDVLKKRLGFDYAYGNELEIENGVLTGNIKGPIIDGRTKAAIVEEICQQEGMSQDEVVAVGDGSNDQIMVANAGLGIGFNATEVLKKVAAGSISKDHLKGVIYCMGITYPHKEMPNT